MEVLAELLWGVPAMGLLMLVGVVMSIRTGFVQVRKFGACFRQLGKGPGSPEEGVSSFQAVCTALAATVGTGNIAGVAGALALGGPGAVFWMWVSAFFGMATKYAEVVLAHRCRRTDSRGNILGGAMFLMEDRLHKKWLGQFFAAAALLVSFTMGNMTQVHTIAASVWTAVQSSGLQKEPVCLAVGALSAVIVALVTGGGLPRVGKVMEKLVPVMALVYILGMGGVMVAHWQAVPRALEAIVLGAFSPQAVVGGGVGIGLRQSIRWGVSRGVFSNEAGLGSAPMVHAAARAKPEEQGLMGIFEVFVDTMVLCTMTAVTILVSGVPVAWGKPAGEALAAEALQTVYGPWAAGGLAVCVALLALATIICWQVYGRQCAGYLFGPQGERIYTLIYPAVIVLGAAMELSRVWAWADICNGLMALPNLLTLLALQKEVTR